jgi:UDP-N-acetylmuramoyl-tripeptide--D-alanyl-D-alanine ligase
LEELSLREIVESLNGELITGDPDARITGVSTDTRSLKPGDLFFALKGETDGHRYVAAALNAGAVAAIVSDTSAVPSETQAGIVKVEDTLWALGDLASYYRQKFDVKVIGVTGSVGKTTTKEMIDAILSRKWRVLKNEMNFNNEIGVPLTLFNIDRCHEVVILEMGMRGIGEIRRLASIAKPSIGVITNVGMSHIERLGSQGAIADAKSELLAELPSDGTAVLNYEDGYYEVLRDRFPGRRISFGSCKGADVIGARIKSRRNGCYSFVVMVEGGAIEVKLQVVGLHNVFNALAAAAAARALDVDLYTIRDGLEAFSSPAMRMEIVKNKAGFTVINDAYNANPASMSASLRTLQSLTGYKRKIAVLGDMLELGDYGPKAHHDIGSSVAEGEIDLLVTVGDLGRLIADGARESGFPEECILSFSDSVEAGEKIKDDVRRGDVVLVKGSRALKMEEIVRALQGE